METMSSLCTSNENHHTLELSMIFYQNLKYKALYNYQIKTSNYKALYN